MATYVRLDEKIVTKLSRQTDRQTISSQSTKCPLTEGASRGRIGVFPLTITCSGSRAQSVSQSAVSQLVSLSRQTHQIKIHGMWKNFTIKSTSSRFSSSANIQLLNSFATGLSLDSCGPFVPQACTP